MSRGKARPFGVICTACNPAVRKRFASELARQRWNRDHVATVHPGKPEQRNRRYLLLWEQSELDLPGGAFMAGVLPTVLGTDAEGAARMLGLIGPDHPARK